MRIPRHEIDEILERWPVARLATLAPDGRPHQVPIVFARAGGVLWSPVDVKPKRAGELARVRNVRREPRVSLLLDHYDGDWTRLFWIRIDAEAEVRTPTDPEADPETAAALAALRGKYAQYREGAILRKPPTLLRIRPQATSSWCAATWHGATPV